MDIITIGEVLGAVLFGGGLLEFVKWLYNRKSEKKATDLENLAKTQEILEHKNGTVEEWEKLSAQHNLDIEYYRAEVKERAARIDEKDALIDELKERLNNLSSENTALRLTRCEKLSCPDRIPPFGFTKIDIRNGILESAEE